VRAPLLAVLLLAVPGALFAQVTPAPADSCPTGRIADVYVGNTSIFDDRDSSLYERFRWAYRAANALHIRTRESVIRRELLFKTGDCYDPFLIEETERLLRAYLFILRAEITPERLPDGRYIIRVLTQDNWSTRVDFRLRVDGGVQFEGVSVNEQNLLGTGQRIGAFFFEREITREYGVSYFTPQLMRTRWDLALAGGNTRAGTFFREEIAYPFVGEVSRWGGRQSFLRNDRFFNYIAGDDADDDAPQILVPVRDKFVDLALVRRIGRRGNNSLIGVGLSYHQLAYPGKIEVAPEGDFDNRTPADSAQIAAVTPQSEEIDNLRVSALLGHRNVSWVERRGLESLRGLQDVKLGAEVGLALGRSVPSIENDDDFFATFTLYTGVEAGRGLFAFRGRTDVRRDLLASANTAEWEDLYGDAEFLAYWQLGRLPRSTLFFRAASLGAWNTRTPFQITLGGDRALRGYDNERFPGGRRAVFSLEHRFYAGWPFPQLFDFGTTLFADVGRIWPGDVPFGTDSGWRSSAGFGLRGAFPAGSRTSYRVDFAWPLEKNTRFRDFRVRFSIGESLGLSAAESDFQFLRSRAQTVGGPLFEFRN
jgi:hypothetical protein